MLIKEEDWKSDIFDKVDNGMNGIRLAIKIGTEVRIKSKDKLELLEKTKTGYKDFAQEKLIHPFRWIDRIERKKGKITLRNIKSNAIYYEVQIEEGITVLLRDHMFEVMEKQKQMMEE